MQSQVWYNSVVSLKSEKKSVQIAVKISETLNAEIEAICSVEDRPVGYVARELMLRGLALYKLDGRLRDEAKPGVRAAELKIAARIDPSEETLERNRLRKELNEVPQKRRKAG